jgi:hypothetical protein
MTATATMNGKPQRKQLADQLDRLDSIIACRSEFLSLMTTETLPTRWPN